MLPLGAVPGSFASWPRGPQWPASSRRPEADSVARKINRETVVLLGWGRAILFQLAHPLVAAAIADYSPFRQDPRGYLWRARRTVGAMLTMTFGTVGQACATAARINAVHAQVKGTLRHSAGVFPAGTPYSAFDPELLRWVHATLLDSLPLTYERFVGPLTREERDRYCVEAAAAAPLLGISQLLVPTNVVQLNSYIRSMLACGEIEVTETARALARALLAPHFGPAAPVFRLARLTTIGLLPPVIREGYGFGWDERQERTFNRFAALVRWTRPFLPLVFREWRAARFAA